MHGEFGPGLNPPGWSVRDPSGQCIPMTSAHRCRFSLAASLALLFANSGRSQEAIRFAEEFRPGHAYKVEVQVRLAGRLALPAQKGQQPQVVPLTGTSKLVYEERI